MKQLPNKLSWKELLVEPIVISIESLFYHISYCFGWWNCDDCENHYSPKVRKYYRTFMVLKGKRVCSLCYQKHQKHRKMRQIQNWGNEIGNEKHS